MLGLERTSVVTCHWAWNVKYFFFVHWVHGLQCALHKTSLSNLSSLAVNAGFLVCEYMHLGAIHFNWQYLQRLTECKRCQLAAIKIASNEWMQSQSVQAPTVGSFDEQVFGMFMRRRRRTRKRVEWVSNRKSSKIARRSFFASLFSQSCPATSWLGNLLESACSCCSKPASKLIKGARKAFSINQLFLPRW